jgi:PAS domain S-box-containing protein
MNDPLRLFLVEDDDDIAFLMRKSLERAGHSVTVCHSGADALIVLGHSQFHLVLLDQKLPDMSGTDLLECFIREGITTPVLMVTGVGDEKLASHVMRAGALDYIAKDRALTFLAELPKRVQESYTRYRLQQTNRLLIAALESANDGIIVTDLQGRMQHVNAAAERLHGYDRQDLLGNTPRIVKAGVHSKEFFEEMWQTILNRQSWQSELVNRRKDGTLIDVSLAISPIVDPQGQLTNFVGIYRDVSERKNIERQLFHAQKMQSVGTLAGGVAHEFNNLLAGIQGYASLALREKGLNEGIREFLDFIVQLSDRAANLTRQLLAFARKPALTRSPVSMQRLLESTAKLVQHTLNIEISLDFDPAAATLLALADSNQLQQVLVNLVINARDATPRTALKPIAFRLRRQTPQGAMPAFPQNVPAGDYLVLEVEDQGQGMSPEVLSQAFDPFFTTKEVGQGTGLGLPVAFGIINGHQGHLTIESQEGQGTLVRIFLPVLDAAHAVSRHSDDGGAVLEPEKVPGRKILVIDDEPAVGDVVRRFLEIAGHEVVCCTSAALGLEQLTRGFCPDLIMLDLMIPMEDGPHTYRNLRAQYPGTPVLLSTGLLQPNVAEALGIDEEIDILRKPFRMNELWYRVNQMLDAQAPG